MRTERLFVKLLVAKSSFLNMACFSLSPRLPSVKRRQTLHDGGFRPAGASGFTWPFSNHLGAEDLSHFFKNVLSLLSKDG